MLTAPKGMAQFQHSAPGIGHCWCIHTVPPAQMDHPHPDTDGSHNARRFQHSPELRHKQICAAFAELRLDRKPGQTDAIASVTIDVPGGTSLYSPAPLLRSLEFPPSLCSPYLYLTSRPSRVIVVIESVLLRTLSASLAFSGPVNGSDNPAWIPRARSPRIS